jgi:dimethylaniline monooxygenase (N-oxide forming)
MADPVYDVIIIGGGLSGLISARRYLDAQPSARISILEKDTCLGGVFSSSRTYPGFYTQWPHGLAEFSDLAMPRPPEEDCIGDTYKAKYQTKYFEEYADAEMADGRTLRERMRFSVEVRSVEKVDGVWKISCLAGEEEVVFSANRLMIASGAYTRPNIPDFVGRESFLGPVIHTLDFGSRFSTVLDDMSIQHVTIVGAGKSAADMAYQCAKAGKEVTWMISEGGSGPGFFVPIDTPTPGYKNAAEAAQTRLMAKLQPTILHHDGFWVWLLHRTWCGILLVGYVFGIVDKLAHEAAKYHERKNERGFEKLEYSPG